MQTVKRRLVSEQTLEPTQVAGFNQFFDDLDGTKAERYGAGIDLTLADNLYGGAEVSRRDLEVPLIEGSDVTFIDQEEDLYRAYLYWAPHPRWAFSAEALFEKFDGGESGDPSIPDRVRTITVPLSIRYFHPNSLFAELTGTYVHQDVELPSNSVFEDGSDDDYLVDLAVGYRLPKRHGLLSLEVRNLFDREFRFQDQNIQTAEPSTPHLIPDRTIWGAGIYRGNGARCLRRS